MDMRQSVGDADNFRFFHTPTLGGYSWPLKFRRIPGLSKGIYRVDKAILRLVGLSLTHFKMLIDLKDETLHVRIAGVDAPEVLFTLLYNFLHSYHMASSRQHILGSQPNHMQQKV